jgi:hypothetical protein
MQETDERDEHEKFKELCALAQCKALNFREQIALDRHLKLCESCRGIYEEYCAISEQGMAFLLADDDLTVEANQWDSRTARENLMHSILKPRRDRANLIKLGGTPSERQSASRFSRRAWALSALAACAVVVLSAGSYRMGVQSNLHVTHSAVELAVGRQAPEAPNTPSVDVLDAQAARIARLERQSASAQEQVAQLRAASSAAQQRVDELQAANGREDASLQQVTAQRDQLANQLAESEKAYEILKSDYSNLRADHDRSLLHSASMETEVEDMQTKNQDQERRLNDDEKLLAADRDIRELMGARKLYIADVFDVDSESHTRKPFGRVFYTQDKSLLFYAYDLEHKPGVQNTSVFQVWGQRDGESNSESKPMNLGILYMDSESNRRWVLRSEDPRQLAEIDAVFVTVEPHGGSQKPTGKPLLYALLRKEANHP